MPNKKRTKKKTARANASKSPRGEFPHGAKAEFVRSRPDVTVQELVALAKNEGMSLTAGHVYNIRSSDRTKEQSPPRTNGSGRATTGAIAAAFRSSESVSLEPQLRTIIYRLGLDRTEAVFADVKAKLAEVNGGAAPAARPRGRPALPRVPAPPPSASKTTEPPNRGAASAS